jgi:hypothetical protein
MKTYRGQTLQRYYKEDYLGVLKEYVSVPSIQEMIQLDITNRLRLLEILQIGMKKEDLNVILYNSKNITDEVLENFKRPTHHRIPMILFQDFPPPPPLGNSQEEVPGNIFISPRLSEISVNPTVDDGFRYSRFLVNTNFQSERMLPENILREQSLQNNILQEQMLPENILREQSLQKKVLRDEEEKNSGLEVENNFAREPMLQKNIFQEQMLQNKVFSEEEKPISVGGLNFISEPTLQNNILQEQSLQKNIFQEQTLQKKVFQEGGANNSGLEVENNFSQELMLQKNILREQMLPENILQEQTLQKKVFQEQMLQNKVFSEEENSISVGGLNFISEPTLQNNIFQEQTLQKKVISYAKGGKNDSDVSENILQEQSLQKNILREQMLPENILQEQTLQKKVFQEQMLPENILLDTQKNSVHGENILTVSSVISNLINQEENHTKNDLEELSWNKPILEKTGGNENLPGPEERREGHHSLSPVNQEENNTKNVLEDNDRPSLLSFGPGHNLLSQTNQEESHHKSLLERSLLKIKERKLLEEQFQKKLKGLVKRKQEQYEQIKPTYQYQDKNYQFYQEYVVTLAKHYNVPIPTISAPVIVPSTNLANLGYQLPGGRRPRRPL